MKSSKLNPSARAERREDIMTKRENMHNQHVARGRSYVRSSTTKFDKHSSDRQRARYARQIVAGQIRLILLEPAPIVKPKRAPRARKTAG